MAARKRRRCHVAGLMSALMSQDVIDLPLGGVKYQDSDDVVLAIQADVRSVRDENALTRTELGHMARRKELLDMRRALSDRIVASETVVLARMVQTTRGWSGSKQIPCKEVGRSRCGGGWPVIVCRTELRIHLPKRAFQRAVKNGDTHVEEWLHRPPVPTHLLLLRHPLGDDFVD
jgi:hypothetical protein